MQATPDILATQRLAMGDAQIVEWRWPTPIDLTVCEERHMIEMSLPPLATEGRACFPDVSPRRFAPMGGTFLRPAGVSLRAVGPGGHIQVARLSVEPNAYEALVGSAPSLEEPALHAGLNLHGPVRNLLVRLRQELANPGFASVSLMEAYATALVIETARSLDGTMQARMETGSLAGWQQRRVHDRIMADGSAPSLAELAELCGIGIRHFTRLYRALTGETAMATIARQQAVRARKLLRETDLPLKDIASRLGFARQGSFSAAFQRETGVSPSRYRQRGGR
jgi:AraC family transcriptional regulator